MTGIGVLLCLVFSGLGPDGLLLSRELLQMGGPVALPLAPLARTAEELWLVRHWEAGWGRAFSTRSEDSLDFAVLGRTERLLPSLQVPRLFLYSPHFQPAGPGRGFGLRDLPVDTVEYLMKALLDAHLRREMVREDSLYPGVVAERAAMVFERVPAEYREIAYLEAMGDFGAHLLSIAHEVNRAARRAVALDREPCLLMERHVPLLRHWEAGFNRARFNGRYARPASADEEAGQVGTPHSVIWVETGEAVEFRDKELFVRHIFGGQWVGQAASDFSELCTP